MKNVALFCALFPSYVRAGIFFMLGVFTIGLGACGIKPSEVDPPQGEKLDTFPRTYPDPQYDPAPERLIR